MKRRGATLLAPLSVTAFRRLWAGASLSMLADQAFLVSLTWLVLRITESGTSMGAVLAVASVPGIVLTPLGGVLCDRFAPVHVMSAASAMRAALMAILAILVLTGTTQIWHVCVLAGGLSALDALYYPASMSAVPTLVSNDSLNAANALTQAVEQISGVVGPAQAGLLLAFLGLWTSLGTNAVLFLISAAIFVAVARAVSPAARTSETTATEDGLDANGTGGTLSALVEGVRHAWSDPVIRTILLVLVGINLAMAGPVYVGGSLLAETRLGGAGAFGTIVALAAAGALVGAAGAGSLGRIRRRGLVEVGATAVIGVGVGCFAFAPNLLLVGLLAILVGMTASFMAVMNISWLQERAGEGLVGRIMSLAMFSTIALDPVSYVLAGFLVEVGLTVVFLAAGGLLLFTALIAATSHTMRTAD